MAKVMDPARLEGYATDGSRYDELLDEQGEIRPQYRALLDEVTAFGEDGARRAVDAIQRLITENGVTYNVYADPHGRDRPWQLDPLPLLLTESEWATIEAGITQRAMLLDRVLADLYGPQHLLSEGLLPPELPFGHPNFLWPCRNVTPLGQRWLYVYAADLARSHDGHWWVLSDRTQTPSGAGYALENRQIISQLFPELIQKLAIRPIGGFFASLREQLLAAAPADESPLAAVLTPGPYNETYFEHAYLARQLGLPLVEGHDLAVRGDTVFLKTLGGLRRVHAILRRLDDDYCDPLELRADSALGVPGLLGAVRAGRVLLANGLGSGVLESAAWMGFLPAVAERLLGEPLRLPSVATWWCGERPALDSVTANLDQLVIKPAFPNQRAEPVFGRSLDSEERTAMLRRLRGRPHVYVAQERLSLSQAPAWRTDAPSGVEARAVGLRVYAIAAREGFRVIPGGLARVAPGGLADIVSSQRGGGSKDVWVMARGAGTADATLAVPERNPQRHAELPSGMVENVYWFGRYAERCEDKARLLRATLEVRADPELSALAVSACRRSGVIQHGKWPLDGASDPDNPSGLHADLKRLDWCATQARGRLSAEQWRCVSLLRRQLRPTQMPAAAVAEALDRCLVTLAALAGLSLDGMPRDDAWILLMLGRRIERLHFATAMLATSFAGGTEPRPAELEWLLDVADSTVIYRTRYLAAPRLRQTSELLITDTDNPRSLAFQWSEARQFLARLSSSLQWSPENPLLQPVAEIEACDFSMLEGAGEDAARSRRGLCAALERLVAAVAQLSDRIAMRCFAHVAEELRSVAS